ncbi:MAG TPA: hypothetical protein VFQ91_10210 [Bryobacteraceae bacterium]|nr:hypothetical protein [Bryobacteraceae bacterium]
MNKWMAYLVLGSCLLSAQEARPKSRWRTMLYRVSVVALTASTAADVGTSWGGRESNPALRGADGRFGARGAALKFGLLGGALVTEYWLHRKHPNSDTAVMIFNASMAAVSTRAAVHNAGVQRRAQ